MQIAPCHKELCILNLYLLKSDLSLGDLGKQHLTLEEYVLVPQIDILYKC